MPQHVDFKVVKAAVSILQVLERYGVADKFKRSGDSLSGPCPIHDGQNKTQFRVSEDKNCWRCFGYCNRGGGVLDFVAQKENVGLREAALLLCEWFDVPMGNSPAAQSNKPKREPGAQKPKTSPEDEQTKPAPKRKADAQQDDADQPNKPLGFALQHLDPEHPYLGSPEGRGLSPECIAHFGLGFCDKGSMTGRVVIPIHNAESQLVAYAGRWPGTPPDSETPRYKLPPGFRKARELFNAHRAFAVADAPMVIVEGFFDCIALSQHGIRRVVALMGTSLSAHQEELIARVVKPTSRIILMLDEDNAGREARVQIAHRLAQHCYVKIHRFEREGAQPDSLTAEEAAALLK